MPTPKYRKGEVRCVLGSDWGDELVSHLTAIEKLENHESGRWLGGL